MGAAVRIETASEVLVTSTQSDQKGVYRLSGLSPGDFVLVAPPYAGFAASTLPIHLITSITGIRVTLQLESVSQEVTVGPEQSLDIGSTANRDTVSVTGNDLRKLPVCDQDYIAVLTPFLDSSAGSSGGATIIVDGVEMKTAGVSPSAIQEVRINNDPYSAEFTRPGRGRIEIITKPGSPHSHGEANLIVRDATFNAKNHFAVVRPLKVVGFTRGTLPVSWDLAVIPASSRPDRTGTKHRLDR